MANLINTTSEFFIFEGDNYYSRERYTLEEAQEMANTLTNCSECVDCQHCTNCHYCTNCYNCNCCSDLTHGHSCVNVY